MTGILRGALLAAVGTSGLWAQRLGSPTDALDKLSVEELFEIEVTSVGRKAQQMSKAPGAVFVLTAEDIRRSGAASIPEALRLVPGMTVARVDGRSWVISARGGARLYSDKMLVMIDGRSLYYPLFSGVIWDSIGVLMEDIERIEVVRGPGAVMWGPNAVNGVINIITKRAQATRGGLVRADAGNERTGGAARAGFAAGDNAAYRISAQTAYDRPAYGSPGHFVFADQMVYTDQRIENLDAASTRIGFRLDAESGGADSWMIQGDVYRNDRQDPSVRAALLPIAVNRFQGHTDYQGGFVQGSWTRSAEEGKETTVRFSYDRNHLNWPFIDAGINNVMADVQRRTQVGEHHEIHWGGGFQQYWDSLPARFFARFEPVSAVYRVGNVVARDEWQIMPARLTLSAGLRLDYASRRQFDYQPSVRLLYTPSAKQSLWAATSRAVRAPARYDRDIDVDAGTFATPPGIPLELRFNGSPNMRSEVERSIEAGYRRQSGQRWSFDASAFWSKYERLRILSGPEQPLPVWTAAGPVLRQTMTEVNGGEGRSYGGEVWGHWQARPKWRVTPSYSYLNEKRRMPATPGLSYAWDSRPATIGHQGALRSQHDLARTVQLDVTLRARSRNTSWDLPGALLADARLGWRPTGSGELSVAAQNLTDRRVLETYAEGPTPAIPIRRTFLVTWRQRF